VRAVVVELHKSITGDELVFPSVRVYLGEWLERKGPEVAASTLAFYKHTIGAFLAFLGEDADKGIDGVTLAHLTGFRNDRLKRVSARTVNHDLKGLRGIFKAAKREGLLIENPAENLDTVRVSAAEKKSRRPFTLSELRAVLDVAGDEWRSMILFGLYTGMRLGDVARLTWSNLDTLRGELRYVAGKTGKVLVLPLAGPLADHVAALPVPKEKDGPLHPAAWKVLETTGKSGGLSNQFGALLAAAGLRMKESHKSKDKGRDVARDAKGLSFHCLRHTAVSLLKDAGIPASVVQELVGHDSAQMSEIYTHTGMEALTRAAEAMPNLQLGRVVA
jgi:integrase